MTKAQIIDQTAEFVKDKFKDETSGHDWWHMYRVWQLAKRIAEQEEGADMFIVELGALLHDIADWKLTDDEAASLKAASEFLASLGVEADVIDQVVYIIGNISYKGAKTENKLKSLESRIVHDADKLDALGAIGIARTFAFAGSIKEPIHEPGKQATLHETFEAYKNHKTTTVNHFYEKLLLLKDKLFTKTGKQIAEHRHEVMEQFLKEFYAEWDGQL